MLNVIEARAKADQLYRQIDARRLDIEGAEKMYRGEHPLLFATDEWNKQHRRRYQGFSDNWCGVVADAPSDRTAVIGFELPDTDGYSGDEKLLWNTWLTNEMEAQQSQGFLTTRIARRSYVMVWADSDGQPTISWEHPAFVEVEYDDENPRLRRYAIRTWRDDDYEYLTLYTQSHVWKFQRGFKRDTYSGAPKSELDRLLLAGGSWSQREVRGETWPVVNPLGSVPIVEVQNRPMLRGEPLSDIEGVAAMQHAINLLWAYLFVAADYASMTARVALGVDPPKVPILDSLGRVIGERPVKMEDLAKNRMLFLSGQGGSIAQWDAADLETFTNVIELSVSHIASQTRTPSHYLVRPTGVSNVSADAFKMDEVGLATKVREMHLYATPAIREVNRLVALVLKKPVVAQACRIGKVNWKDPEIHSDAQLADAFQKDIASGWPFEWVAQKRGGLGPDQLAEVMKMKAREQQSAIGMGVADYLDNGPEGTDEEPVEADPDKSP